MSMTKEKKGPFRGWRHLFRRTAKPPKEFFCPISNSLMFDPAVVSSGHTFDRVCVQVCRDLDFTPTLPDGSIPNFSTVVPNLAVKAAISDWCYRLGTKPPVEPEYSDIESVVLSISGSAASTSRIRAMDPGSGLPGDLSPRNSCSSSSSEKSVIVNLSPPLLFANSMSPSLPLSPPSSEYVSASSSISCSEDENFLTRMQCLDVFEQEQAVIQLRSITRTNEESRATLCTEKLLFSLKQLLNSRYATVQSNAAAALVNLSLEKENKAKIRRNGLIPSLIEIMKNGFEESREHAVGAIFSLSIENENKAAMGFLGAIPPLLHLLRSGTAQIRRDATAALYHLTLLNANATRLINLGAAGVVVGLLKDAEVASAVVLVICNLAGSSKGRAALLDANAVECLLGILRNGEGSEVTQVNCVAALSLLSIENWRFTRLARTQQRRRFWRRWQRRGVQRRERRRARFLMD